MFCLHIHSFYPSFRTLVLKLSSLLALRNPQQVGRIARSCSPSSSSSFDSNQPFLHARLSQSVQSEYLHNYVNLIEQVYGHQPDSGVTAHAKRSLTPLLCVSSVRREVPTLETYMFVSLIQHLDVCLGATVQVTQGSGGSTLQIVL